VEIYVSYRKGRSKPWTHHSTLLSTIYPGEDLAQIADGVVASIEKQGLEGKWRRVFRSSEREDEAEVEA
jgi:hypothetical protein